MGVLQGEVEMDVHDDRSLLALQGPAAAEVLGPLMDLDLKAFYFSQFAKPDIAGIPCFLTRTGFGAPLIPCCAASASATSFAPSSHSASFTVLLT